MRPTKSCQRSGNFSAPNPVATRRLALRLSQEELARRAGVTRTLLSSVETGRATPSVAAALALARALKSTVEELFQPSETTSTPVWALPPGENDSRYWEVRDPERTLRYPASTEVAGGFAHDGVGQGADQSREAPPETLTMVTCDPSTSLLVNAYAKAAGYRLLAFSGTSRGNLDLLAQKKVHLGAIHCGTRENADRNLELVREKLGSGWAMVRLAWWESGLAVSDSGSSLSARRLARYRWALREPGAAAHELMERMVGGSTVRGNIVPGHRAVADSIRSGWAEAGICIRLCAEESRLRFRQAQTEALDLVFAAHWLEDRRFRRLLEVLQSRDHRRTIGELPGYSSKETGTIFYS